MRVATYTLLAAAALAVAGPAMADDPPAFTFALHGFLGASLYAQDAYLGPSSGGQAMYALPRSLSPSADKLTLGGDVRQSRLNFSVTANNVKVLGATPKAVAEVDFFGSNGAGAYGDVSLLPRMRVAYAELGWTNDTLNVGQMYQLVLSVLPASVGHQAFPVTYEAGTLGWRYPGFTYYHRQAMGDMKLELALQIQRASWGNPNVGPFADPSLPAPAEFSVGQPGLGEASALPAFEARATLSQGATWMVSATGHWSEVDPSGLGTTSGSGTVCGAGLHCQNLQVVAGQVSAKLNVGPLTLQGNIYAGKNTFPLLGELLEFQNFTVADGDVHEWGGWAQAGYNLTKEFSVWGLAGTEQPNSSDVRHNIAITPGGGGAAGARLQNTVTNAMVRYMENGFALALEYTHWHTVYTYAATSTSGLSTDANQLMVSGFYFF